jgi:hypothetical protein
LKHGGGVSWSHRALHTYELGESTVLTRGLIDEVSILSPGVEPAEPFARVAWVGEEEQCSSHAAPGEVIYHPPVTRVRRNIGRVTGVDLGAGGWLEFEDAGVR